MKEDKITYRLTAPNGMTVVMDALNIQDMEKRWKTLTAKHPFIKVEVVKDEKNNRKSVKF